MSTASAPCDLAAASPAVLVQADCWEVASQCLCLARLQAQPEAPHKVRVQALHMHSFQATRHASQSAAFQHEALGITAGSRYLE